MQLLSKENICQPHDLNLNARKLVSEFYVSPFCYWLNEGMIFELQIKFSEDVTDYYLHSENEKQR